MAPHLATATIEHIGATWRVCANGICKEHQQEWQAKVYYHQMINNPTAREAEACQRECLDE
jgi:hypothetical protein